MLAMGAAKHLIVTSDQRVLNLLRACIIDSFHNEANISRMQRSGLQS